MKASDANLESAADSCERWGWFGGGLVVVGLIAEGILIFLHPTDEILSKEWAEFWATLLITVGVALEIMFSRMGFLRHGEIKRRSDLRAAEANQRAAEASARANEAALALEKYRAPRTIPGERHNEVIERVSKYAGTSFWMGVSHEDPEVIGLGTVIALVLTWGGWKPKLPIDDGRRTETSVPMQIGVGARNVTVVFGPNNERARLAAQELAEILNSEGILAAASGSNSERMGEVAIWIGPKT